MTTDINELAQRMKAATEKATPGQWERGDGKHGGELLVYCDDALGSAVCEATSEYNAIPKYKRIDNLDFIAMANPANIIALVEALEKAQTINAAAEKLVRCKGRYHSEKNYRSLAALFGVTTPDLPTLEHENVHYADAAEMEIAALRQRIAELENYAEAEAAGADRAAEDSVYWMKRCKELESRTVKLPKPISVLHRREFTAAHCAIYAYPEAEVNAALDDAGIKVEAE
ncbi:TPA: ead/Ea22-like family protein [Klebsiella pneumoniae]